MALGSASMTDELTIYACPDRQERTRNLTDKMVERNLEGLVAEVRGLSDTVTVPVGAAECTIVEEAKELVELGVPVSRVERAQFLDQVLKVRGQLKSLVALPA